MKNKIQPISALRDTNKLEKDLANEGEIVITKNGYADMVIMSMDRFEELSPEKKTDRRETYDDPLIKGKECDCLGFVRVKAATIDMKVSNVSHNVAEIIEEVDKSSQESVNVLVFQELTLSGYTCGDLFLDDDLLTRVEGGLSDLREKTKSYEVLFVVGAPLRLGNSLYNCAVVFLKGEILGVVPKTHIPNYTEFYEARHFSSAPQNNCKIKIGRELYPFGTHLIYSNSSLGKMAIGVEICEDLWVPSSPSSELVQAGATIILNLSASNEVVGKESYRRNLVSMNSAKNICAYVYADAGMGESTTDLVFASHNIIAENGKILGETPLFEMKNAIADIDLDLIDHERRRTTTFVNQNRNLFQTIPFSMEIATPDKPLRHYARNPFIPEQEDVDLDRVKAIILMQANGLANRLRAINCKKAIIGVSGGLDSTLALLVTVEAFKKLGFDQKGILGVTMPAFGTSERTHNNATALCEKLGVSFREIPIGATTLSHLKDIGVEEDNRDIVYENAQARERTQVLFDLANKEGGIVVGTGDFSELCLGWCTYNGDHMSMYGVNASIPKTLVRYLCKGYALMHEEVQSEIFDIIDTPISPELLPTKDGEISQLTEEKIGPYELHDFFIYHYLRYGYRPKKLFYLARIAYEGKYDAATIKKWLREFYRRFFANQFKRSCLPDGAKIGTVAISPRGDWRMPSDASSQDYLNEIDSL